MLDQIKDFGTWTSALKHVMRSLVRRGRADDVAALDSLMTVKYIELLQRDLLTCGLGFATPRTAEVRDRNGGSRKIEVFTPEDSVVQRVLHQVIYPIALEKLLPNVYGLEDGRGWKSALGAADLLLHSNQRVLRFDIADAYHSIPEDLWEDMLLDLDCPPSVECTLGNYWGCVPDGLPVGGSLSSVLFNLCLHPLDVKIEDMVGAAFIRYYDDYLCVPTDAHGALDILALMSIHDLEPRSDKTILDYPKGGNIHFLGYRWTVDRRGRLRRHREPRLAS